MQTTITAKRKEGHTMAIIAMSKAAFSGARELAQCVSGKLGYRLVSREDVTEKTVHYGMSGDRVDRVRRRRLGMLPRMDLGWIHYIAYARAALTKEIRQGNLIYLGNNGRALLHDLPNVLHVSVVTDIEHRIDNLIGRTDHVIDRKKARRLIQKIDEKEARWRRTLFDNGWHGPSESGLVVEPALTTIPDTCELIRATLEQPQYHTTRKSLETIDLLTVAAELRARIAMRPNVLDDSVEVEGRDGVIVITGSVRSIEDLDEIKDLLNEQREVDGVEGHLKTQST